MYTELSSITFSVIMSIEEFEAMDDGWDYNGIMNWFPDDLNVTVLDWDGHFGARLIVTCEIEDTTRVDSLCVKVRDIVRDRVGE